jgi:hypothetical protein
MPRNINLGLKPIPSKGVHMEGDWKQTQSDTIKHVVSHAQIFSFMKEIHFLINTQLLLGIVTKASSINRRLSKCESIGNTAGSQESPCVTKSRSVSWHVGLTLQIK